MSTLITGGTGLVGCSVVEALPARGEAVRALVRAGSDRLHLRHLPVETVVGDLEQPPTLRRRYRRHGYLDGTPQISVSPSARAQ